MGMAVIYLGVRRNIRLTLLGDLCLTLYVMFKQLNKSYWAYSTMQNNTLPVTLAVTHTLQRNLILCIPRQGIERPQSQFPHSCVPCQ
jgi:hypothetical protein